MVLAYSLVILSGLVAAASGAILRWIQNKDLLPSHLMMMTGFCGAIYFGIRAHAEWHELCWLAVAIGVVGGATQYLPVRLFKRALELGPLSPAWCVFSLAEFVPVIIFSLLFMGEHPTTCRWFSLLATFVAIVFASMGEESTEHRRSTWRSRLVYLFYLVVIFVMAGMLSIGLKYSSTGALENQQNIIMCFVYFMMFLLPVIEITAVKRWTFSKDFWICGGSFTAACLTQFTLILFLVTLPAALVFALSSTVSLLAATLFSTFVFREKRTPQWYAMLAASIIAILLNR